MPRLKDQAICIRHLDWSETSQVVVLLTQTHGKVRGLAKGSKRMSPSSVQRFSGGIELLTLGQIVMTIRPSSDLATLTEWDLQHDFYPLRHDLAAQRLALYGADLCHAMLADHDPHPRSFDAMHQLLLTLVDPARDEAHHRLSLLRFQWELLDDTGYRPELWQDVHSGGALPDAPAYTFDPKAGGMTTHQGVGDWRVRKATVRVLQSVASGHDKNAIEPAAAPPPVSNPAAPNPDAVRRANRLLCVYLRTILDRELPTMRFVLSD